ncbi:TlpA family protein disulfide reductase [Corynebacterium lowii]|uniref:Thiol-disulfide oxidoreductase ResA n=1 Tax=Corynebacterium lowii TaxID=1544413 RepID=A0A0Q0UG36_9CORY|nr:TlpA disulfide reductase family protein [Corynebacterium lowii]KQB87223.1 Thiol-disulfide oxidoreductase ResA [Corynebacterium lowii]MDP9852190.1 thiol-disulfide isomerase/thioredoxin [Corynebacterium lowii]
MKKQVVGYVVAVLAVLALLLAVVPGMMRGPETQEAEQQEAEVAQRPECAARGVAGVELPCLGASNADQEELSEGAVTVVNVWAWWCAPCREELPLMESFAQAHPEYRVVGVHADARAASGAALLNELGVDLPSFQDDDNSFAGALELPGVVPITLVVRDGKVLKMLPKPYTRVEDIERDVQEATA